MSHQKRQDTLVRILCLMTGITKTSFFDECCYQKKVLHSKFLVVLYWLAFVLPQVIWWKNSSKHILWWLVSSTPPILARRLMAQLSKFVLFSLIWWLNPPNPLQFGGFHHQMQPVAHPFPSTLQECKNFGGCSHQTVFPSQALIWWGIPPKLHGYILVWWWGPPKPLPFPPTPQQRHPPHTPSVDGQSHQINRLPILAKCFWCHSSPNLPLHHWFDEQTHQICWNPPFLVNKPTKGTHTHRLCYNL